MRKFPGPPDPAAIERHYGDQIPVTELRGFPVSLYKRAKKRDLFYAGNGIWNVHGDAKLGDKYDKYLVTYSWNKQEYRCECYERKHGDARKRRVCSHVLAVMIWREEHPDKDRTARREVEETQLIGMEEAAARAPFR